MDSFQNGLQPKVLEFENLIRTSFSKQEIMKIIGGQLGAVIPGEVEIKFPFKYELTQQHGFLHAGIITTMVDSACGYAAFTLMPANAEVLTIEYKVNFIAPAKGELFVARGKVVKPGRVITVCAGEVFSISEGESKLVATMSATMMTIEGRSGITPK